MSEQAVVTGEAVELDLRPARLGSRLVARLLDTAIQIALLSGLVLLVTQIAQDSAAGTALALLSLVGALVGYPLLAEWLWRGRTLGKAALGLRAVRDDGGPLRFRHALVRALVGAFVDFGVTLGSGAVICSLLNSRGKRIGDVAAGTIVVQERVPSRAGAVAQMPQPLAGWAATADLSAVPPQLFAALRQLVAREAELLALVREEMGSRLVAELLERVSPPPPPGTPGWALVRAVLAERTRRERDRSS